MAREKNVMTLFNFSETNIIKFHTKIHTCKHTAVFIREYMGQEGMGKGNTIITPHQFVLSGRGKDFYSTKSPEIYKMTDSSILV